MIGYGGAYGFRLIFPEAEGRLHDLVQLDQSAPAVTLGWRLAPTLATFDYVDEHRVSMGAEGRSSFHVRRDPASINFDLIARPQPDALVHPLGTVPLAVLARWRGDVTLHAGAFADSSGAWAVAGERGAGKSTMLALLAERGFSVVADDLLSILEGSVWSGPQCVDLRPDAAVRMSSERDLAVRDLGMLGGRRRYRLSTPPAPPRAPLRGMFVLEWSDRPGVTITQLSMSERLKWLYGLEYIGLMGPVDPQKILGLMRLPAWRLTRPSNWAATEEAIGRMLEVAAA